MLGKLFSEQCRKTPDAVALFHRPPSSNHARHTTLSYNELHILALKIRDRVIEWLASSSGESGRPVDMVAVCLERSPLAVAAIMGLCLAGIPWIPLDPKQPPRRITQLSAAAVLVLVEEKGSEEAGFDEEILPKLMSIGPQSLTQPYTGSESEQQQVPPNGEATVAYGMWTSGTTGRPRMCVGTVEGLLHRHRWMGQRWPWEAGEVACIKTSLAFVDSVGEIFGPLLQGIPACIVSAKEVADPVSFLAAMRSTQVSRLTLTPSHLQALLTPSGPVPLQNFLKVLCLSGESFPSSLEAAARKMMRPAGGVVLNLYGTTELSGDCAVWRCDGHAGRLGPGVPIGRGIEGVSLHLVRPPPELPESGKACCTKAEPPLGSPPGSGTSSGPRVGELVVQGPVVALGYMDENGHGINAAGKFLSELPGQSPSGQGCQRYFRTGDLCERLGDGSFLWRGRIDDGVKIRGERIDPYELEQALGSLPGVQQAIVLVSTVPRPCLVAMAVLKEAPLSGRWRDSLYAMLQERLPPPLLPTRLHVVASIPRNANGKVDRDAIHVLDLELAAAESRERQKRPPSSQAEASIAVAFETALELDPGSVGVEDDFFEAGGDSLSVMNATQLLAAALGYPDLSVQSLIDHPTPKCLAEAWQRGELSGAGESPRKAAKRDHPKSKGEGGYTQSSTQQGLGAVSITRANRGCGNQPQPQAVAGLARGEPRWGSIWSGDLRQCVDASPLIVLRKKISEPGSGTVYIGSHAHRFAAFDLQTGKMRWSTRLGDRVESSAAASLDGSRIVVGCYDGTVYTMGASTGEIDWKFPTGGEVKCSPTVDLQGRVWVGSHSGRVFCLDLERKECVWQVHCGGSVFATPAVDPSSGRVHVATTNGSVLQLDPEARVVRWQVTVTKPVFSSPVVARLPGDDKATLAVLVACAGGVMRSLSGEDGTIRWKKQISEDAPFFSSLCSSPMLPGRVFVGCHDSFVYCVAEGDGAVVWKTQLSDGIYATPFVFQLDATGVKLLAVACMSGRVHLLEADTGKAFSSHQFPGQVFSSPVVVAGPVLVVGCRDNRVYALRVG